MLNFYCILGELSLKGSTGSDTTRKITLIDSVTHVLLADIILSPFITLHGRFKSTPFLIFI